ncbi:retrovirus-related Pol polyprotein from transposon 17.6 [Trichonephila clavipes]|nr:retrovirus-related Pol polyprotein from transposon 17.6 [Trichonephila clavipes]
MRIILKDEEPSLSTPSSTSFHRKTRSKQTDRRMAQRRHYTSEFFGICKFNRNGQHFKIVTDCSAFQKTTQKKELITRIARWALQLEEFDYEIEHRDGSRMKHVDALSRYPVMIHSSISTYHVDFIGPLTSTNKSYQHIFPVVDAFTKFTWLYPVKTVSAESALEKLKQQQKTFGNPIGIISDRGSASTSKLFNDFCDEENIQHLQIATDVSRGNGQVERIHRTLIPVLTKLSLDDSTK